ncbi:MAG: GDSL-type esterase/lipase family protein [Cyanobacteria bacterium P01_F01_bin.150]
MSPRIFFIGDSFTNGTGDPTSLGWVGRVCAQAMAHGYALTCYNLGIRGDTTQLICQRWQQEVQCRLAETAGAGFVFSFGANDVNLDDATGQPRVSVTDSLAYARTILMQAQKLGPVLMVESPPIADDSAASQRLAQVNQQISDLCSTLAIPHIQTCQALLNSSVWMEEAIANDGAHPKAKGYAALADTILGSKQWPQWLEQLYTPTA